MKQTTVSIVMATYIISRLSSCVVSVASGFAVSRTFNANWIEFPSVLGTVIKKAEKRTVASSSGDRKNSSN
jgi:hypothetical protein